MLDAVLLRRLVDGWHAECLGVRGLPGQVQDRGPVAMQELHSWGAGRRAVFAVYSMRPEDSRARGQQGKRPRCKHAEQLLNQRQ